MSRDDTAVTLRQMVDHAHEAINFLDGTTQAAFYDDRMRNLAVVRLLEVVSEAAARISHDDRARFSSVRWSSIVGLRNRLIHGYDTVDLGIVWQIVQNELPEFVMQFEQAIAELTSNDS